MGDIVHMHRQHSYSLLTVNPSTGMPWSKKQKAVVWYSSRRHGHTLGEGERECLLMRDVGGGGGGGDEGEVGVSLTRFFWGWDCGVWKRAHLKGH